MVRRNSQQMDNNTRYLRNYYDVRFQLSPDTLIAKRDGKESCTSLNSNTEVIILNTLPSICFLMNYYI